MRARILFIALPAAVIAWSVYGAIQAWDARDEAKESEQWWRAQAARMDTARRRQTRVRAPAVRPPSVLTAAAAAASGGGPALPRNGAVVDSTATAPRRAESSVAEPEAYPDGINPTTGAVLAAVEVGQDTAEAPASDATPVGPEGKPAARAELVDRGEMIRTLRERFGQQRVQVEEIRVSGPRLLGDQQVRTVRIKLLGKRTALDRAFATLQKTPEVGTLSVPKLESAKAGQMRLIVTGTVVAGG
jgi:hypothetical protein